MKQAVDRLILFISNCEGIGIADSGVVFEREMYFQFPERVAGNARPV